MSTQGLLSPSQIGKDKHIDIQFLWVQDAAKNKTASFHKVPGHSNPADLMTKGLGGERIPYLMGLSGYAFA